MIADLKPYPAMKDSGVPWLGEVPAHWKHLRARYLFREIDRRSQAGTEMHLSMSQKLGLVPSSMVEQRTLVSESYAGGKLCDDDDLVLNRLKAHLGVFAMAKQGGVVSPDYTVLRRIRPMVVQYFEHVLRSPACRHELRVRAKGIVEGFWRLYTDDFFDIRLPAPPIDEQTAIVRFLDHADRRIRRYIRAKEKLIKLLEEQKQAIIHRAVTRGLDPNVRLKPSGVEWLGDVPEHWEVLPLSRLLAERKETNSPIKTTNILSLSLATGVIPYADKKPGGNKAKEDLSAYMLAYPGDIVLNSMNVVVGSVGLSKYFGAVSPVYYMLHPRRADDLVEYFNAIFHSGVFQRSLFGLGNGIMYIESKSSGKLNTIRLRIPMGKLKRVQLPYPGPEEQAAIVEHLARARASFNITIDKARREVDLLQEYRTRLIADVVTGKLDVREAAARLPDEPEELEAADETERDETPESETGDESEEAVPREAGD
jgi:type I restriction enzyme S subunit